jgi:hypothetical protein
MKNDRSPSFADEAALCGLVGPLADVAQVEEDVMQSSMRLSGVALGGATLFATTAIAGGLPKEGAFSVADETRGSARISKALPRLPVTLVCGTSPAGSLATAF